MCGRINQSTRHLNYIKERLPDLYATWEGGKEFEVDRGDVRPTQPLACVRINADGPQMVAMTWGVVRPRYTPSLIINARSEKFGGPWKSHVLSRRCAVLVSGYYEWVPQLSGSKDCHAFALEQEGPMWLAGLWELDPERGLRVVICTTEPGERLKLFHDRQPVILDAERCEHWLSRATGFDELCKLASTPFAERMLVFPALRPTAEHIPQPGEVTDKCNMDDRPTNADRRIGEREPRRRSMPEPKKKRTPSANHRTPTKKSAPVVGRKPKKSKNVPQTKSMF